MENSNLGDVIYPYRGFYYFAENTLQGNLEKVVRHGKRADLIVKNMLLHSRQGSGEHRLVDVNALVEENLNLAYHGARAEKQGFNIILDIAEMEDSAEAVTRLESVGNSLSSCPKVPYVQGLLGAPKCKQRSRRFFEHAAKLNAILVARRSNVCFVGNGLGVFPFILPPNIG